MRGDQEGAPCISDKNNNKQNKFYTKMEKKNYMIPEVELIELETEGFLAASVGGAEGGSDDGGSDTTPTDPSEDGWGADY